MNLIDELYRSGCLDHSGLTELQLEVKRAEGRRDKLEEELRPKLGEEGIKLFEAYEECRTELTILHGQSEFIQGFRFGGRLAIEMLED